MAGPEAALAVPRLVDQPHHRRVGRDEDAPLGVLLGDQVHRGAVGEMPLEGIHRLVDQRHAVGQEQHPLRPVAAHEQVAERDHRAGLAGAGGHHHQRLAVAIPLECLGDAPDAARLVVALDDLRVDLGTCEGLPAGPPLDDEFQFGLLVEALHLPGRVAGVVPDPVLVAVGVEDHRPLAEPCLQAIGVELGLLLALASIAPRPFRLDQPQRLAVVAPEDVIHETRALGVGHAGDFELPIPRLVQRPARFLQQQVDKVVAGLGLGIVVGIRLGGSRLLRLGDFGPQPLQLFVQRHPVGQQRRELLVPLAQRCLQRLELFDGLSGNGCGLGQRTGVEGQPRRRLDPSRIRAGQPVADMEQLAHGSQGIVTAGIGAMAVDRLVAELRR